MFEAKRVGANMAKSADNAETKRRVPTQAVYTCLARMQSKHKVKVMLHAWQSQSVEAAMCTGNSWRESHKILAISIERIDPW